MSKNTQLGNLVNGIYVDSTGKVGVGMQSPYGQLTIQNISSNTGGVNFGEATDAASRRWQLRSDTDVFGDFGIRQSTTQTGSTYVNRLYISPVGNIGIGVTPSIWANGTENALQIKNASIYAYDNYEGGFSVNAYYSGGWKYISSAAATQIKLSGGNIELNNAPSGTAGNAITFTRAVTLTSAGNLGIGTSSPAAILHINGSALPMVVASTSATDLYCEYRYNTSSVVGYIGNGTGIVLSGGSSSDFGIRAQSNLIFTSGGGTERMRISSTGNVGIGTTSAGVKLEVYDTASSMTNNPGNSQIRVSASSTQWLSLGYDATVNAGFIQSAQSGVAWRPTVLNRMGGNVMIGTGTDNGYKLNVGGAIFAEANLYAQGGIGSQGGIVIDYGYAYGMNSNTQNSANAWNFYVSSSFSNNIRFFYGGTGVGTGTAKAQIDTSGNYSALSDINKKKDIALSTLGLTEVMQLKPTTFKFKDDEKQEEQIGFIAQEVKDIIPHAYYEDSEGEDKFIGLNQTAFIPVLVKAIQELKAEIDILKNK